MHPLLEWRQLLTRRHFFASTLNAIGWGALASLLGQQSSADEPKPSAEKTVSQPSCRRTHHPARARNVISLFMVGGPSQMDLFDYKPTMTDWFDKDLPDSVRNGQRIGVASSTQTRLPIAPSKFRFARHGQSGTWISELLPWTARIVDELCVIRSLHTETVNHEPALTYAQTGNQLPGRPCLGAWTSYGLGSLNKNLPTFVILVARPKRNEQMQPIPARLWQSYFLPGEHAGVPFRTSGEAVLYVNNPPGIDSSVRRLTLDGIKQLNEIQFRQLGDPETMTRIQQYEMAYRMQTSVPELTDLGQEPASTFKLYGDEAQKPGTFANTALLARRLVERGVRFVQIYHNGWDTHKDVVGQLPDQCLDVDQACFGLIQDLKQRGLLNDTVVSWGGEFGRTIFSQGDLTSENYGRDHHAGCFTSWLAGGGTTPGKVYGETDEFCYNIVKDPVHVRDFHATILHLLGFDHRRLTVHHQGLDQRLTGTEPAQVIQSLVA